MCCRLSRVCRMCVYVRVSVPHLLCFDGTMGAGGHAAGCAPVCIVVMCLFVTREKACDELERAKRELAMKESSPCP